MTAEASSLSQTIWDQSFRTKESLCEEVEVEVKVAKTICRCDISDAYLLSWDGHLVTVTARYLEQESSCACGLVCDVEQVLVVHGSQQGSNLCARLLLNADDAFVIDAPGYLTAQRCSETAGARLWPTPWARFGHDSSSRR